MRLLLVHGRAQGERSADEIKKEWLDALREGCRKAGTPFPAEDVDIRVPFYGRVLDDLTATPPIEGMVVARGAPGAGPDPFQAELLLELAGRAGISDEEVAAELGATTVPRGPENWHWVQAAGRLLCLRCPWLGPPLLRRITADVHAYMTRLDVGEGVNALVAAELGAGPAVVVGHSLGSVVAYWVLTEQRLVNVPLFVTVGSPLGIHVIKRYLPRPLGMPQGVAHWLNAADERDPVALYSRLDRDHFPAEIENLSDLHNPRGHPHAISGYLSDRVVARRIAVALAA
jgi:hypothetical protein